MDPAARVLAVIALCVALSGTAYAAKTTITGKNVKNESLTGKDVKDGSLGPNDFNGSVQGPQGPQGPAGAPGSAVAYGVVEQNGSVLGSASKNIAGVTRVLTSTYCVDVAVPAVHAVVSPMVSNTTAYVLPGSDDFLDFCPGNPDFLVVTTDLANNLVQARFSILVN